MTASTVEAMLRREEHLRLCAETQAKFHAVRHECDGVFRVVEDLQHQVVREFGLPIDIGLNALRCAEQWLGNDRAKEVSQPRGAGPPAVRKWAMNIGR